MPLNPKRLSLLCLALLYYALPATGQMEAFSMHAGGALANIDNGLQPTGPYNAPDNKNKVGLTGGIKFDFPLGKSEVAKISPELFIIQNGSREYYNDLTVLQQDLFNQVSLDYVGIYLPITLATKDVFDMGGVYVQGRIFADYAFGGQFANDLEGSSKIEFVDPLDRADFGFSFSFGIVTQTGLGFMLGYNWGIKDIEFEGDLPNVGTENYLINTKGFTLQVGAVLGTD